MRILVCGGRDMHRADAWNWLEQNAKDELAFASGCFSPTIDVLINGGCRGADEGARDWGKSEGAVVITCPANWKKHGKAAGPIRNLEMLVNHKPDYVIALPGGKGTANMVNLAKSMGVPVIEVEP